jgi:hypothetical protein
MSPPSIDQPKPAMGRLPAEPKPFARQPSSHIAPRQASLGKKVITVSRIANTGNLTLRVKFIPKTQAEVSGGSDPGSRDIFTATVENAGSFGISRLREPVTQAIFKGLNSLTIIVL